MRSSTLFSPTLTLFHNMEDHLFVNNFHIKKFFLKLIRYDAESLLFILLNYFIFLSLEYLLKLLNDNFRNSAAKKMSIQSRLALWYHNDYAPVHRVRLKSFCRYEPRTPSLNHPVRTLTQHKHF